jgi:hypothetical protein
MQESYCTFAVGGGDEGRVGVDEAALVEELVRGEGHGVAHAHGGGEQLGARAQVGLLAQELQRVALLGHRVVLAADSAVVAAVHRTYSHRHITQTSGVRQRGQQDRGSHGAVLTTTHPER